MTWKMILLSAVGCVLALTMNALAADQPPDVKNTTMTTQILTGSLERTFDELTRDYGDPIWVGYYAPLRDDYSICCGDWDCRHCLCKLESRRSSFNMNSTDDILDHGDLMVLVRIDDHEIDRIRAFSEDCPLDADDVPFIWLDGVSSSASIRWLSGLVEAGERRYDDDDVIEKAISTIALHDDPTVLTALKRFVEHDQPEELREQTVFWIGSVGGHDAVDILLEIRDTDPSSEVREKVVFALTLPDVPEATDALIEIARNDRDSELRGNALFWLSNEAGERAAAAIENALENDPDTDVKERAVFALSNLPNDEGIPKLIHVARTNRNPEVRKQAIFWLGQSDDPRVLDFFEDILAE